MSAHDPVWQELERISREVEKLRDWRHAWANQQQEAMFKVGADVRELKQHVQELRNAVRTNSEKIAALPTANGVAALVRRQRFGDLRAGWKAVVALAGTTLVVVQIITAIVVLRSGR